MADTATPQLCTRTTLPVDTTALQLGTAQPPRFQPGFPPSTGTHLCKMSACKFWLIWREGGILRDSLPCQGCYGLKPCPCCPYPRISLGATWCVLHCLLPGVKWKSSGSSLLLTSFCSHTFSSSFFTWWEERPGALCFCFCTALPIPAFRAPLAHGHAGLLKSLTIPPGRA